MSLTGRLGRTLAAVFWWLLLLLLSRCVDARTFFYEGDENIVEAKEESGYFETSLNPRIVEFYNPYCGHCISFKSKFRAVVEEVQQSFPDTEAYGVSCVANNGMCRKYNIEGYPAVFVLPANAPVAEWKELLPHNFSAEAVREILQQQQQPPPTVPDPERSDPQPQVVAQPRMMTVVDEDPFETSVEPDLPGQRDVRTPSEPIHIERDSGEPVQDDDDRVNDDAAKLIAPSEGYETMEQHPMGVRRPNQGYGMERPMGYGMEQHPLAVHHSQGYGIQQQQYHNNEGYEMEGPVEEGVYFGARQGSIPMRGAEAARGMEREMDRWKEHHRQHRNRKHRIGFRRPPPETPHEGATTTMKSHQLHTPEFAERIGQIGKTLAKIKGRKKRTEVLEKLREGERPYKKVLSKEKFTEKIPLIRMLPTVKLSAEEELILDASFSFLEGIRHGVFKSEAALSPAKQHALFEFLNVMSAGLPPEWGLHDTIDSLLANFDTIVKSAHNLHTVLDLHPFPRKSWGPTCSRSSNPFTCGFWKLLHTMTVGIAEQRGGLEIPERHNRLVFSPLRAAEAIKGYMEHFFFCDQCSDHFLERYNDCNVLRRCARLVASESSASDADWKELAKWLWEFHNIVSVDILRQDERRMQVKAADEVKVIWPTLDGCFFCFNEDGTFNEEVVFIMLEKTYWPGHDLKETPRKLLSFDDDSEGVKFGVFLWLICFAIVYAVGLLMRKKGVKGSIIRAKTLGRKVLHIQQGGKTRVV